MKVENAAANLFNSQRTQADAGRGANQGTAFATIMAEKLRETASQAAPGKPQTAGEAKQYDFTHISRDELLETVNGLIRSGDLNLDDTSSLLGMMGSSPMLKVHPDGLPLAGGDVPMNVFARLQEGIEGARSRHDTNSIASLQRAAEALARFQKTGA